MFFCTTLNEILLLSTIFQIIKSSCDVFKFITTPDTGAASVNLDLSTTLFTDFGIGVWTRFQSQFEENDSLNKKVINHFVFAQLLDGSYPLIYYIKQDREAKVLYFELILQNDQYFEMRELELKEDLVGSKWVFFYFCYSKSQKAYNTFVYVDQDTINVQMAGGGEYQNQHNLVIPFTVGGDLQYSNEKFNVNLDLTPFVGEISDLDLRTDVQSFYSDIPTFLSNLEDTNCEIYTCPATAQTTVLSNFYNGGYILNKQVTFFNKRFILFGWVKLNELADIRSLETVFIRATFRKIYYGDKYQGEKALYWKYYQSTMRDEDNGFEVSTYHNIDGTNNTQYQTLESDTILQKSAHLQSAITSWHWFVYQEGLPNSQIQLSIYLGKYREILNYYLTQVHYEKVTYYFNIGGDKFIKSFSGEVRNLTFSYCQLNDNKPDRYCHYSCNTCFGPNESDCIDCVPQLVSKRLQNGTYCPCINSYLDVGLPTCQNKYTVLGGITIQEGLIGDSSGCQRNQFLVKMKGNSYCLNCPGAITPYGLYCIDCIYNPNTWYLNPICKIDYLMPFTDQTTYVFIRRDRKQKDYEYFLIIYNSNQDQPVLETCFGCLGQTNSTINFIEKYTMNQLSKILCKNCYTSLNGECVNLSPNCDLCDDNQQCTTCQQNYTLFESKCYQCPNYCPDCKYNSTGYYCKSCINRYYYNSTLEQCQQCGAFCEICFYQNILNILQCVKCVDNQNYFIAAEYTQCLPKNQPNCKYQVQEIFSTLTNETNVYQTYKLSMDLQSNFISYPSLDLCLKCNPHYINFMKCGQEYGCYTVDQIESKSNKPLPLSLKQKVINDPTFELGFHEKLTKDGTEDYYIMFGDSVIDNKITYNPIVLEQKEIGQKVCRDIYCQYCIQNYVYTQEYCIKCFKPYYAHKLQGNCIICPPDCVECEFGNKIFKDGWKSDLLPGYQMRSKQEWHHFNLFALSTTIDDYEVTCLKCADGLMQQNGKCYPKCPCESCIIENEQVKCVTCQNSIKTVINDKCTQCPQFCELCREFTSEEITQINPYFDQQNPSYKGYAKQCLKRDIQDPPQGILYNDPSLGQELNCKNVDKKDCYFFVELQQTIYCGTAQFQQRLNQETDEDARDYFMKYNLPLQSLFSSTNSSHFYIETNYLFTELNVKSVKLIRYIVNVLPNSGDCIIKKNTFIQSQIRQNVFTAKYVELIIQSQNDIPIQVEGEVSFLEFSTVTLKNVQIIPTSQSLILNVNSIFGVAFLIDHFSIKNAVDLQFQIKIQNPNSISIKNFEISDSKLNNINGIIRYYFTLPLKNTLIYNLDTILIKNCQIVNSNLFVQILGTDYGNQKLIANNFQSYKNTYTNSIILYTEFPNQLRESEFTIQQFLSDHEQLTQSSLFILHGALNVILTDITVQNGDFFAQVKLFKLPLFTINNMLIVGNNFESADNRVITNVVDALYQDKISISSLTFNSIIFRNNFYKGSKVFIELIQSQNFKDLRIQIDDLSLESNQFTQQQYSNQMTSSNSSVYFDLTQITIQNLNIVRAFTLPEISINNVDKLVLKNVKATLNSGFKIKLIHQQLSCIQQTLQIGYGSMLQIFNTKTIEINNLQVIGLIVLNMPIITIKSLDGSNYRQSETITIQQVQFSNNTMILTKLAEQPTILSIISEQKQEITLSKVISYNNHHHNYQEDLLFKQSSTILIQNPNSNIALTESNFSNNILTNNQGSNLVLISNTLLVNNCNFQNQNDLQFQYLRDRLIWGYNKGEVAYFENLYQLFSIKSKGGNGYLSANQINLYNITSNNSLGLQGGAFYFGTQSSGSITIENCVFNFSQANLQMKEKSQGGTLYIDASQSDLHLQIMNNSFTNSYSRNEGGTIFIEPSRNNNSIIINENTVENVFSFQNAFLKLPVTFSSKSLILLFTVFDLSIKNTYFGYLEYLGKVQNLSSSEISLSTKNYLISIERGNITLRSCYIFDIFDYGSLEILEASYIKLDTFYIQNITIISGSILSIQLNKKYLTQVQLVNVKLKDIAEVIGDVSLPNTPISTIPELFYKCDLTTNEPTSLKTLYDQDQLYVISLNNFYVMIKNKTNPNFIFEIDSVSANHYILLDNVNIQKINCTNCQKGVLKFTNIDEAQNQNLIYISGLYLKDSQCGIFSCFVIAARSTNEIQLFSRFKSNRILDQEKAEFDKQISTVKIEKSLFDNNQATFGGGILISALSSVISNCQFTNNIASSVAGALYFDYELETQLLVYDSVFANNEAKVGGALYLSDFQVQSPSKMNNVFQGNQATYFGDNLANQPTQLTLQIGSKIMQKKLLEKNSTNLTEIIDVKQYKIGSSQYNNIMLPSGQAIGGYQIFDEITQSYIPYNFTFRIIPMNDENNQIKALEGSKCFIRGRQIIEKQEGEFLTNFTSITEVLFNATSQDYNLDQMEITFDPDYSSTGYLQLEITCNSIQIPIFQEKPPYLLQDYFTNYRLRVNLQTFPCQRGEYKTKLGTCKLCDSNADQYNVKAGDQCKIKDPIKMEQVSSARVMLRPEYWRPFEYSDKIEYCLNLPENCVGGWNPGNDLCSYAHVGALCEQCDIYNIRGQGAHSVSTSYKCGSCSNIGDNTIKVTLVSIWTMISIMLSVKGTVETVDKMITQSKMHKLKIFRKDPKAGYGSVLIKVLTNYLQIIGAVSTFQLKLPSAVQSSVRSVGNPTEAMSFSLDCFLVNLVDIDIIYFRMIWALIMPILYIFTFLIIYAVVIIIRLAKPNKSAITTTAIYLFTYLQPTLIGGFISLLSFRQISNLYWIQGNVAYRYDTETHFKWVLSFILPSTITLAFFIPAFMFISLYKQRHHLDQENTRKNWGYLYNEYQTEAYFWEIVKILEKGFIIIFLTFYEDLIIIKGALVFMIVFVYQVLTRSYRPYKLPFLNLVDEFSTLICGTSIVIGMTIYQSSLSNNQEIIWPFYMLLIIFNLVFIIIILWEIILAQLEDQQENIDKVRDLVNKKYPRLINSNWIFKRLLTNRGQQQKRVKRRFQMIRNYLMKLVRNNPGIYKLPTPPPSIQEIPISNQEKQNLLPAHQQSNQENQIAPQKNGAKVFPVDNDQRTFESVRYDDRRQSP
ncbi:unnamed protein product [Paramecium octaurelia]|uniref:Laminin EGF-like domain-containing protein n=1 Tax=Paramecium octaurelia TaxID=43137 RepID=A0A8S1UPL9_PAROT|nr:unnamed protein product [Paramecium octaurelia]